MNIHKRQQRAIKMCQVHAQSKVTGKVKQGELFTTLHNIFLGKVEERFSIRTLDDFSELEMCKKPIAEHERTLKLMV